MPENNPAQNNLEYRVLVLMPTGRDAVLIRETLEAVGLSGEVCADINELEAGIVIGVGAILLAEEALQKDNFNHFVEMINQQPVWSDIPVVLLAASEQGTENLLKTVGTRLNITILDRPLLKAIVVSAMRGALRARKRQYQARDLLDELKEADQQKELFLATLSHELRTPLNSIIGWVSMLKNEKANFNEKSSFDRQHALEVIDRNAKAQNQIINDILLLSRIVTGKFKIEVGVINLVSVVQAAIETVEPQLKDKEIDLQISFAANPDSIRGDFDRLQQVFWNLFSNAVKFTPKQGKIIVEAKTEGAFVIVSVTDSGQGIKADFLPFVFERFRQADNSYTRSAGGLGLGLAIVRNIVEQHEGRVSVESEGDGQGATFRVQLPLATQTEHNADGHSGEIADPSERPLAGLRILLAEDDADSREMLVTVLEYQKAQVEAVESATEALASLGKNPPHIIISDLGMPDMDGYELIKKIRQLPDEKGGKIPAIALTGYAGSLDRAQTLQAGYHAHLAKPIDFDELFITIQRLVEHNK